MKRGISSSMIKKISYASIFIIFLIFIINFNSIFYVSSIIFDQVNLISNAEDIDKIVVNKNIQNQLEHLICDYVEKNNTLFAGDERDVKRKRDISRISS